LNWLGRGRKRRDEGSSTVSAGAGARSSSAACCARCRTGGPGSLLAARGAREFVHPSPRPRSTPPLRSPPASVSCNNGRRREREKTGQLDRFDRFAFVTRCASFSPSCCNATQSTDHMNLYHLPFALKDDHPISLLLQVLLLHACI
jgi:hypothetical protein